MRNLTKVLALVLSLAFVMTMFAGAVTPVAKYSDAATTTAGDEAVTVLRALGIVDGYPDGSYGYEKNVTRAEYAKLIAIAANGEDTTPFYNTEAVSFKDTVDAWAKPYVNYCYLTGILAGYTDGTVKAANPVKGVEAVKMTLVALGYNPVTEGLVGANWINNTVTLAQRAGLLVNLEGENLYNAFDREAIAILVYNALYADTVEYIGNTAVATEYTLGEDAFDLLDVRATVVAVPGASIDVTYYNVLDNGGKYANVDTIDYKNAKAGTSTVVYLDYTGAATVGGYYVPRALTVSEEFSTAELGKTYRVLTTGCKTPYNTTEIRKVYGVIEIADNGYTETYAAAIDKITTDFVAKVNNMVGENDKFFKDGKPATKEDIVAWIMANNDSNSPVIYTDYDKNGILDTIKVYTRSYYEVLEVTDTLFYIKGGADNAVSTLKVADYPSLELVKGDWLSNDARDGWQKLSSVSGMVMAIGTGSIKVGETTVNTGVDSKTTMQDKVVAALGGQPGVNATVWYDADGKAYVVDGELTDAASWQNYGIVTGWSDDVLGMQTVRLFTADNTYKTYVVTSINGNKQYDQFLNSAGDATVATNSLVKYYVDGNTVALYTYNSNLMIGEKVVDGTATYNYLFDRWTINNTTYSSWDNAVIFASVEGKMQDATDELYDRVWRAYRIDEFQPIGNTFTGEVDAIVENLNSYIKVAAITAEQGTILPGLVLGNDQWLTLTEKPAMTYSYVEEDGTVTYTYTLTYITANTKPSTTSTATVKSNLPLDLTDITDGDIVRATFNEDGEVIYWVDVTPGNAANLGSNGVELGQLMLDKVVTDRYGKTILVADRVIWGDLSADTYGQMLTVPADCNFYLVNGIGTGNASKVTDNVYLNMGSWIDALTWSASQGYTIWADINTANATINSLWIDTNKQATVKTVDAIATLDAYIEGTKTAVYTIVAEDDAELAVEVKVSPVLPQQLPCNVGMTCDAEMVVDMAGNVVSAAVVEDDAKEIVTLKATSVQEIVWNKAAQTVQAWTGNDTDGVYTEYKLDDWYQIWWNRDGYNGRYDGIGGLLKNGADTDEFYQGGGDCMTELEAGSPLNQNFKASNIPDTGKNYEEVILVDTDGNGAANIIVLVDTSEWNSRGDMTLYPYSAEKAAK